MTTSKSTKKEIMKMIKFIVNIERKSVSTIGFEKDGNINFLEAGIDGLTEQDEIIEAIEEQNGETPDGQKINIVVSFV